MSDDLGDSVADGGVSPLRKKISGVVLVVLLVVLGIEVRASLGHSMAMKALKEKAPEGVFENRVELTEIKSLMSLAPSESVVREGDVELEYRYGWLSLLRPVLGKPESAIYVVSSKTEPPYVMRYGSERPSAAELAPRPAGEEADDSMTEGAGGAAASGPGGGGHAGHDAADGTASEGDAEAGEGERRRPALDEEADSSPAPEEKPSEPAQPEDAAAPKEAAAEETPAEETPADSENE